jgi:peptidoglycan/xylan/chitin deacetylase (PgdA/CDA1 family)
MTRDRFNFNYLIFIDHQGGCTSTMRILALIIFLIPELISFGQQKNVCFTMDDMPVVSYGITDTNYQKNLFNKLTQSLRRHNIPAIGFVIGKKLIADDAIGRFQVRLLKSWLDAGLDLGNHTYSHPDYNSVSLKEYSWDIEQGEPITKKLLADHGKAMKYFRHPYLHVGKTKEKADSLQDYLSAHGYTVAPVTIDNDDYLFAVAYKRAQDKNDRSLMTQIGSDYIRYLEKKLHYYERQAQNLFGRAITQILLFHASALNSDYGDSLARMFERNNYSFVSLDNALEDPVYKTEVTSFGNYGISWLDRWALSQGKTGEYFKDDPVPPDYIKKMSK